MLRRYPWAAPVVLFCICLMLFSGCTVVFQKGRRSDIERIETLEQELDRLARIKAELESKLKGVQGVSLSMEDRGLVVTFLDEILFDSGKDKIRPEATASLDKVSAVIVAKASDLDVGVEGHTDNEPIKHSGWQSNWALSTARANSVVYYLEKKGVDPARLAAIGYGEHRPVASNETPEGRRKNRRVEIVILPKLKKAQRDSAAASDTGLLEPRENLK